MVTWQRHIQSAEMMLDAATIPASEEIIRLIKRINPTTLDLPESCREQGYALKVKLQNLLLENYGETFQLEPHPYDPDIVLIKHRSLPSVDACHADLKRLSINALDAVDSPLSPPLAKGSARKRTKEKGAASRSEEPSSLLEALKQAQQLLEEYDYGAAEEILGRVRITEGGDVALLNRAVRILMEEIGACSRAVETLLSQPRQVLKDGELRETLALAYYGNGMLPEARAVLDSFHPGQLSKHALHTYADISMKDGNLPLAFNLLNIADEKDGYVTSFATLRKELDARMLAEALPVLAQAREALDAGDRERAYCLARQAVVIYPNFQQARELIGRLDRVRAEDDAARLWELVAEAEDSQTKLPLLERLAEICRDDRESIQGLIAAEKKSEKAAQVEERVGLLYRLAEAGRWTDCFDVVLWLSRREESPELCRRLNEITPELAALYQSCSRQRQSREMLKESWLTLIRFREQIVRRQYDGCLEMMKLIRPYFGGDARFVEECRLVTEWGQDRAREVAEASLRQMSEKECSFTEAVRGAHALRKRLAILPDEERARYLQEAQAVVERLRPRRSEDVLLEEYREALMVGSESRAAALEGEIGETSRLELGRIEVAELFHIVSTPIAVSTSAELPIDLARVDAQLSWMIRPCCPGWDGKHVVLREDDQTVVVIDVLDKTATSYRSSNFKDLVFCDSLPGKDVFLFRNGDYGDAVWRAKLSETQGSFTATFDLTENFALNDGEYVRHLFVSADRPTDYVASIGNLTDEGYTRIVKQNVSIKTAQHLYQVKDEPLMHLERISYEPERFGARHAENFTFLDKHLEMLCQAIADFDFCCADPSRSHLCLIFDHEIDIVDHKLAMLDYKITMVDKVKELDTLSCNTAKIIGVSMINHLFLMQEDSGRLHLYDFKKGRRSVPFSGSRIFCGSLFGSWYYFDYDRAGHILVLRDVTHELAALVEWEQPWSPTEEDGESKLRAALVDDDNHPAGARDAKPEVRSPLPWKRPPGGKKYFENLIKEFNHLML